MAIFGNAGRNSRRGTSNIRRLKQKSASVFSTGWLNLAVQSSGALHEKSQGLDFLAQNREKLGKNHRVGMMYKVYDRMADDKKQAIREDSAAFFMGLDAKANIL